MYTHAAPSTIAQDHVCGGRLGQSPSPAHSDPGREWMAASGFAGFDQLGGGIADGRFYLAHGAPGLGKSIFALQFVLTGLGRGEAAALVTRRPAPAVLEKARAFGFDLDGFVRSGRLALFEYAPSVVESCARLKSEREILDELRAELQGPVKRLVLDPVSPLLAGTTGTTAGFRARALVHELAHLRATTLLLCDSPADDDAVVAFRDHVYGRLRFEAADGAGSGRLAAESIGGENHGSVRFEIAPGTGLRVAPAGGSGRKRRILIVVPDAEERARFAALLGPDHGVEEAADSADALARMAAAAPDLVLIDKSAGAMDGAEFCSRLRANGVNVPVVLLAGGVRRVRDRVALLSAGADECLERPVDPRLLRLKVNALLARYDANRDRLAPPRQAATVSAASSAATSTADVEEFVSRVRQASASSRQIGVPFGLVAVRPSPGDQLLPIRLDLERLVREYDLVYAADSIAFVLLGEADGKGVQAFLERVALLTSARPPQTASLCFEGGEEDAAVAEQWVRERLEAASQPAAHVTSTSA
jgi:DNA-binding response OmpR family regulator/KaiC/GvpD/RAD55 family RecA-like ATPase